MSTTKSQNPKQINRTKFFSTIRNTPALGLRKLSDSQVQGLNYILDEWEAQASLQDLRHLAYMLATVHHECAKTMQPIEEYGRGRGRRYGKRIKQSGQSYTWPNKLYYGRGYVQLTWYENYELMGRLLGIDLLKHPELALQPDIAARIMFEGMCKGASLRGDFTGRNLEQYFNAKTEDPLNARRIINGLDKAGLIAEYYWGYKGALM
ncbi:MAG: hypothetical protein RL660_1662 [Bacteroidota bacterium]|jgi:hypothetical protein